jgi:DNA-directed RNA polymerase-5 subunit 1
MRAKLDPFSLQRSSSSRYDQVVQRLSTTMKTVAKGILKDHLVPVASSTTCSGNLNGFNNAGYKATFRPLKVQVPFIESTLFTPMKCLRRPQRDAILIHWDVWSHHVRGASMQHLALNHLLRFCNENQQKGNKEYGDGLYVILALVRMDQEKARYTSLDDVDYLVEDNAMDDICLSPELDETLGMPTFEDGIDHPNFREGQFKENGTTVNASWEQNASA